MSDCIYEARETTPIGPARAYCITHQSYRCAEPVAERRLNFTTEWVASNPEAERHNEILRELAGIRLALQSIADALKVAPKTHQQEPEQSGSK